MCTSESWLSDDIPDHELAIDGYSLFRHDRNRHGGGIAMYIKVCLATCVLVAGPQDLEFLLLSVHNDHCKIHVGLFYRPPLQYCPNKAF